LQFKPARVARGAVLTITGKYLGDACLDTGTIPAGLGPLGNPLTGLVIVIDQGPVEIPVATGSADSDYAFQVDIVVPSELEPGEASVNVLGAGDARLVATTPLVISSAPPRSPAEAPVATFGPPSPPDTEPPGSLPPVVLPADIPDVPVPTAPPQSAPPIENSSDTGDLQRAIAVGVAGVVVVASIAFAVWGRLRRR
jgi:hypothetical protein